LAVPYLNSIEGKKELFHQECVWQELAICVYNTLYNTVAFKALLVIALKMHKSNT
jgi:hypothetical protein